MGVVFAILGGIIKWILLIILGLVGLILVLLLIVLLTPLRYKIKWTKQAEAMEGEARISWLLHLISFRLTQKGKEIRWTVKIGPKVIAASYPLPKKEKKKSKHKKTKPPQTPTVVPPQAEKTESLPQEEMAPVMLQEPQSEPIAADEDLLKDEGQKEIPAAPEIVTLPQEPEVQEDKPKKSLRRKITDVCWKIRRFF